MKIIDDIGFDGVEAGALADSWLQPPDTPLYGTNLDHAGVREALANAIPERRPGWFAG